MNGPPKLQDVRVLDVLIFGPFMLYAVKYMPNDNLKLAMAALGIGTILLNYENYAALIQGRPV